MSDEENKIDSVPVIEKGEHKEDVSSEAKTNDGKADSNISNDHKKSSSDNFTSEYVKGLRDEAKQHRLKAKELEDKLEQTNKQLENQGKEALDKVNKLHNAFEKKLINAELMVMASKEGLIDKDAFKMVDLSAIKVSDDGEVIGVDQIMADLKASKPYLFSLSSSSNVKANVPPAADVKETRPVYESKKDFESAQRAYLATLK